MDTTAQMVKESSVCIVVDTSVFNVNRAVSRGDVLVTAAENGEAKSATINQKRVSVGKKLIDSPELRVIWAHDAATRDWLRFRSVPSEIIRSGAYLVSVEALPAVYEYLEARAQEREALVQKFAVAYVEQVRAAKKELGPLWRADQYPSAEGIVAAFGFSWRVIEVGTPDAKLRTVSRAMFEKEREKAEKVWSNSVGLINEALAEGLAEVINHLAEKLGGGDEPPKRLHASAVEQVTAFLDVFDSRNLTRNADLAALAEKARGLLSGVDAKLLKTDKDTRVAVAAGFAAVRAGLDVMLENRPARAVTFVDEEV